MYMPRRLPMIAVFVALMLPGAAPAPAQERVVTPGPIELGPEVSGNEVIWGRRTPAGHAIFAMPPGRPPRQVGLLPHLRLPRQDPVEDDPLDDDPFPPSPRSEAALLAHDGRIAALREALYYDKYGNPSTTRAAELTTRSPLGVWTTLWSCGVEMRSPLFATSADTVIHAPARCGGPPDEIGVFDLSSADGPRQTILQPPLLRSPAEPGPPYLLGLQVAGPYVAYAAWGPPQTGILDRRTGDLVYRLSDGNRYGAVLQADGKAATCEDGHLVWYAPQEPWPHAVPGVAGCAGIIAFEHDTVAWRRGGPRTTVLQEVALGGEVRTLARFDRSHHLTAWPAYGHGRFAFGRRHCTDTINVATVRFQGPRDDGSCPVEVQEVRVRRPGLSIRVRCPAGCSGRLEVLLGRPRARKRLELDPGQTTVLRVRHRRIDVRLRRVRTVPIRIRRFSPKAGRTVSEVRRFMPRR